MPNNAEQGASKAAVLLMAMGEQHAAEVLKLMSPKEVQAIGMAMTRTWQSYPG